MPTISTFYGIKIMMYWSEKEHNPPHIHATYQGFNASYSIESGERLEGLMPRRGERLVQDFIELNREALMRIWDTQIFEKIDGLR